MSLLDKVPLERVAELGREATDGAAEPMDLGVRLEVTGQHGRHGAAVRADRTTYRPRVEMIAEVQLKVMSVLRHKRTRRRWTFKDALRANVRPRVIIKHFLTTTTFTLAELATALPKYITSRSVLLTVGPQCMLAASHAALW